jgi:hypothetical protein
MRLRDQHDKRKREIADILRKRITTEPVRYNCHKLSKEKLENNLTLNLNLFFDEHSKNWPECKAEIEVVIAAIPKLIKSGMQREKRSWYGINLLLANVHDMIAKNKDSIAESLSTNTYSKGRVGSGFIEQLKLLVHYGLLGMEKGYRNEKDRRKSRLARIWPTEKLKAMMNLKLDTNKILISIPDDSVELRDTINQIDKYRMKKIKQTVPKKELLKRLSPKELKQYFTRTELVDYFNLVFSDYKFTYEKNGKTTIFKPVLISIFGNNMDSGGRFYPHKYQLMSKAERQTVKINGHPTKEYDFGGLHIRILYALAGKTYPKENDPYKKVLRVMGKDPDLICKQFPSIRNDLKEMLLALINGKIKNPKMRNQTALRRANYRLFKCWKDKKNDDKKMESRYECDERKEIWQKAGILNAKRGAKDVLQAFYKAHESIKRYFNGGCPYDLMNIDGEIADYIMRAMLFGDYPIPTLPLHDSFRTLRDYEYSNKLKRAMKNCYQGIMRRITKKPKAIFSIPVKPVTA